MNTLPASMRKSSQMTVANMPSETMFYVTPWSLYADADGRLYVDPSLTPQHAAGGTVCVGIKRDKGGRLCAFIPKSYGYTWDDSSSTASGRMIDRIEIV